MSNGRFSMNLFHQNIYIYPLWPNLTSIVTAVIGRHGKLWFFANHHILVKWVSFAKVTSLWQIYCDWPSVFYCDILYKSHFKLFSSLELLDWSYLESHFADKCSLKRNDGVISKLDREKAKTTEKSIIAWFWELYFST